MINIDCFYKRWRTKNYKFYIHCVYFKKEIAKEKCIGCPHKKYKKTKPMNVSAIKKRNKNKVIVSKDMYDKVLKRDKCECVLCKLEGMPNLDEMNQWRIKNLELHHIIPRSRDKKKINDKNNCVMLCNYHHHEVAHKNMKKYIPILLDYVKTKK